MPDPEQTPEQAGEEKPKALIGPTALLAIILIDVGLAIVGWYVYQNRRAQSYDGSGLSLSKAPETQPRPRLVQPSAEPEADEGRLSLVVKEPLRRRPRPGAVQARPGQATAPGPAPGRTFQNAVVRKAVRFFYDLKKDPRFKNSPALAAWKREFLSIPELKAADDAYSKDGDAVRFMVRVVRSPNFQNMAMRHLLKPEIQSFVNDMTQSPAVKEAAPSFLADPGVSSAAQALGLLSKVPQVQGAGAQPSATQLQQGLQKARENPRLKDMLDQGGVPQVQ